MDDTEVLIEVASFKRLFTESLDYAEMALNKEIVDSSVIHLNDMDLENYKDDLSLGYILCQDDLNNTIYSFLQKNEMMFIKVDELFNHIEKASTDTDSKIDAYIESQFENGISPLMVAFEDGSQTIEVIRYGALFYRSIVINNIVNIITEKIINES